MINDIEYDKLGDKINEEREYFNSLFTPENLERFNSLWDMNNRYCISELRECFVMGFKLAVKMMSEVYSAGNVRKADC